MEQARALAASLKSDATLAEREKEFARREAELKKELKEITQARGRLEQEAVTLRQQAVDAEARANSARQELESARLHHEQAQGDAARWQQAAEEAGAERERIQRSLAVASGQHEAVVAELRQKATETEKALGKMKEELQRVQGELQQARAEHQQAQAELQRVQGELKKQAAPEAKGKSRAPQAEELREALRQAQAKAVQLENMLRQFYLRIVNPLTVTVATTDLAASSQWLSPRDRETLQLLDQNLDHLLEAVKVLKKQMLEAGVELV